MTLTDTLEPASAPRTTDALPPQRRQWGVALRALRRLLNDREDTGQAFDILAALAGDSTARNYQRLLTTSQGGRIAWERVELAERLMDDAWLDGFEAGTMGAAYRDFVRTENLSAEGLAEIGRQRPGRVETQHPHAWFGRRGRDSHDLWHILSGYGRDGLGEACLTAFSYAQTRSLGWAVIAIGAALRPRGGDRGPAMRAIWQGYQRGKACAWLAGEDYVTLMAEPLEAARQRLGLTPPTAYETIPSDRRDPAAA